MADDVGAQSRDSGRPPPGTPTTAPGCAAGFVRKYWHIGAALVMVGFGASALAHALDGWPRDVVGLVAAIVLLGVGAAVLVIGAPDATDYLIFIATFSLVGDQFSSNSVTAPRWVSDWVFPAALAVGIAVGRQLLNRGRRAGRSPGTGTSRTW